MAKGDIMATKDPKEKIRMWLEAAKEYNNKNNFLKNEYGISIEKYYGLDDLLEEFYIKAGKAFINKMYRAAEIIGDRKSKYEFLYKTLLENEARYDFLIKDKPPAPNEIRNVDSKMLERIEKDMSSIILEVTLELRAFTALVT